MADTEANTALRDVLYLGLRNHRDERSEYRINVTRLAIDCNVKRQSVYRWLNGNRMSARYANLIVKLSAGRLSQEDMIPFVMGE